MQSAKTFYSHEALAHGQRNIHDIEPRSGDTQAGYLFVHFVKKRQGDCFPRFEPYFLKIKPQGLDKAQSLQKLLSHLQF